MKKILYILILGILSLNSYAQGDIFTRWQTTEGISTVSLSKELLVIVTAENAKKENSFNLAAVSDRTSRLRVVSTDKSELKDKINVDFQQYIKDSGAESLMSADDEDSTMALYSVNGENDKISEFIIISDDSDGFSLTSIKGAFTRDDIASLLSN